MDESTAAPERLTFLIANHNHGRYIGDCLESLQRQTDPNWLAIVMDDASTDHSLTVIAPFVGDRVCLIASDQNVGYIRTLKRLIAEATTDIVAILDADDVVSPDATRRLLSAYSHDARTEFIYSRFGSYDETLSVCHAVHGASVPEGSTAICEGVVGAIRSFRKRAYERTSGLDESMQFAEDRDLVYKLEEVTRPVFVDAELYRYREVPGSQSRDVEKREVGARNTWRARRAALARRRMSGLQRLVHEAFCCADYVAYSARRLGVVRRLARVVAAATARLCNAGDPRRR